MDNSKDVDYSDYIVDSSGSDIQSNKRVAEDTEQKVTQNKEEQVSQQISQSKTQDNPQAQRGPSPAPTSTSSASASELSFATNPRRRRSSRSPTNKVPDAFTFHRVGTQCGDASCRDSHSNSASCCASDRSSLSGGGK